jgi:gluconokinase
MKIPGLRRSDERIGGVVFFGRTLDKIRLHAQGKLPADYNLGTGFDARVCRFLGVEYPLLVQRVLEGGTDEQIFEWCMRNGRTPTDEEILFFNSFLAKRGWRDETSKELEQMKRALGFAHRTDIQTFFDFHRADEEQD